MFGPEQNVQYTASYLKSLYKTRVPGRLLSRDTARGQVTRRRSGPMSCAVIAHMVATGEGRWTPNARVFCERNGKTG